MSAWPTPQSLAIDVALSAPVRRAREQLLTLKRRASGEPAAIDAYLQLDDAYSRLLLRELLLVDAAYDVDVRLHWLSAELPPEYEPNAALRMLYAPSDATRLAEALGDPFPLTPALAMRDAVAAALVAIAEDQPEGRLAASRALCEQWWHNDTAALTEAIARVNTIALERARQHGKRSVAALLEARHYEAATLVFDGSNYAGIDRLYHLLKRLDRLGLTANRDAARQLRERQRSLRPPVSVRGKPTVGFYFSFRSPFSYLAATTTFALVKQGVIDVNFYPVLPMVSRGQPLPTAKRLYLVTDANREAERLGIPFGRIADPLDAAPDLIRVAAAAERDGCLADVVLAIGNASWAQGIDLRKQRNLTAVVTNAGLTPTAVRRALADDAPLDAAATNMQRLNAAGLFGVPSFTLGSRAAFGQDRLALLLAEPNEEEP
ncbi:MAG: DsbA family protein [Pseudomonadota bacterium]